MNTPITHRTIIRRFVATSLFAGMLTACCALSAQPVNGNERHPPHQPPAEAFEACKALTSGKECTFTTPRGSMKGTCWAPEGKPLACKPKDADHANMEKR